MLCVSFLLMGCLMTNNVSLHQVVQTSSLSILMISHKFPSCPFPSRICSDYVHAWDHADSIGLPIKHTSSVTQALAKYAWFDSIRDRVIDRASPVIARWLILPQIDWGANNVPGWGDDDNVCVHVCAGSLLAYSELMCWLWREWKMNSDKCRKWAVKGCTV